MNCHKHFTTTCCTSQAPHYYSTLMFSFLVQTLVIKRPLIFKNQYAHIKGEYYKLYFNIHWISLVKN
jgi:hypothetical protein